MTPIDILALIFGAAVILKIAVAIIDPEPILKLAGRFLKHKTFATIVYLAALGVVGSYVFSAMSVTQVVAGITFGMLLLGLALIPYGRTQLKLAKVVLGKKMLKKDWLAVALWIALAVWAIYAAVV